LNFLSGREISNNLKQTGEIKINGVDKKKVNNYSAFSAFVQQDDILFQTMSVRECLEFAARLKLPGTEE
jgi:ABC-type multidrug transport system ATPase subunit